MGLSTSTGLACAVGSAVFNGSFAALFKTDDMAALSIHPMVFQLYVSAGIFVSSWVVVPFLRYNPVLLDGIADDAAAADDDGDDDGAGNVIGGGGGGGSSGSDDENPPPADRFRFSPLGLAAGCLFVLAVSATFLAVDDVGIALAQAIWCGGAMIVSYGWGVVMFDEEPSNPALSVSGLVLLVTGVLCIAFSETIATGCAGLVKSVRLGMVRDAETVPLARRSDAAPNHGPMEADQDDDAMTTSETSKYVRGVLWACAVGLFGGSILVPLHYVSTSERGLVFLPSFGTGAIMSSPVAFWLHRIVTGELPPFHLHTTALPTGMLTGFVMNAANLLAIIAIPEVGYSIAYPITQCSILVSGTWGVCVFHEITNQNTVVVFCIGGAILLLGAAMLAISQ